MLAAGLAAVLAACGGGGGGSDDGGGGGGGGGGGSTVTTWGSTTLPGHLIVNSSTGNARIYDLGDGTHRDLPESASADDDRWVASADGSILVRWNDAGSTTATVDFFDVDTLDEVLDAVQIEKDIGTPMLGFDTSLLMAFWEPDGYENALSVFDIDALSVVSENSELDGETIINNPAGWLSDTTYVYLYQNQLVRATPGAGDDTVIATLDLPYNNASADDYLSGYSDLVVSRDGTRVAFTWGEERNNDRDYHVWVADIDGGNLHRLTAVASASDPRVHRRSTPMHPSAARAWSAPRVAAAAR